MTSFNKTQEKLKSILQAERTLNFLNDSSRLGFVIAGYNNINTFIKNVFIEDNDLKVYKYDKHNITDDIIIFENNILFKTISRTNSVVFIKCFKFTNPQNVNINLILKEVKEKINYYKYIFLIRIDRSRKNQPFKVKYYYYLIPLNFFNIDCGFSRSNAGIYGEFWELRSYKDFCLKINNYILNRFFIDCYYEY